MGSQKLLLDWCRLQCESYPNVEIMDFTTSFKDGLAFCAIIHKHRPELIDFHSLSKDKAYENNCLAFEVAEAHLGIPALLDPGDMVVPDRLAIITYLSQYYTVFAKMPHSGQILTNNFPRMSRTVKKGPRVVETPTSTGKMDIGPKPSAQLCNVCQTHVHLVQRHLVDGRLFHRSCFRCCHCGHSLFHGSYRTDAEAGSLLCSPACQQRSGRPPRSSESPLNHGVGVKIPHQEVHEDLNPNQIQEGVILGQRIPHADDAEQEEEALAAGMAGISKIAAKQMSWEEIHLMAAGSVSPGAGVVVATGPGPAPPGQLGTKSGPVPAPRRLRPLGQQEAPGSTCNPPWPPPRTPPAQVMNRSQSEGHGLKVKSSSIAESPRVSTRSVQSSENQKPRSAPWMDLIQPGPWSKLPPVCVPSPCPRSLSVPFLSAMWSQRKAVHLAPCNPFEEDEGLEDSPGSPDNSTWSVCLERDESQAPLTIVPGQALCELESTSPLGQTNVTGPSNHEPALADSPASCAQQAVGERGGEESPEDIQETGDSSSDNNCAVSNMAHADSQNAVHATGVSDLAEIFGSLCSSSLVEAVAICEDSILDSPTGKKKLEDSSESELPETVSQLGLLRSSSEVQLFPSHVLTSTVLTTTSHPSKSNLDPAHLPQTSSQRPPVVLDTAREPHLPTKPQRHKRPCKENPFNKTRSLAEFSRLPASSSSSSIKATAPGHGFPLIKRKVQADRCNSEKDLLAERRQLEHRLDGLERKGVQLEKTLRNFQNDDDLVSWFSLIHEKHMLVRRDAELVYMAKQQDLEERQSDVEYELRCLLNKPEKDWSPDDKAKEKQLLTDLVTIIEQRNQIINNLDQDRKREQEEDMLLNSIIKKKDVHKSPQIDHTTITRKFKPLKILKHLSHKTESKHEKTKSSLTKKI